MEKEQEERLIRLELEARQNKRKEGEEAKTADENPEKSSEQQEGDRSKWQAKPATAPGLESPGEKRNT